MVEGRDPFVHQADGAVDGAVEHIGLDHHGGQLLADGVEEGDRLAELLALEGVAGDVIDRRLAAAEVGGAELEAADVEDVQGDRQPVAGLAQEVLPRHLQVVEEEGDGRRAADAHLLLLGADLEALEVALDDEGAHLALELGEDDVDVGPAAVGDVELGAVEDEGAVVGELRRGLERPGRRSPAWGSVRA